MTPTAIAPPGWSRARWIWTVLFVFGAQLGFICALSDRSTGASPRRPARLILALAADPSAEARVERSLALGDPTLFVLPNRRGFSAAVWQSFPQPHVELTDWTERQSWLRPNLDVLGAPFLAFARAERLPSVPLGEKPPAEPSTVPVGDDLLPTASSLRQEGDLATRPLLAPLDLPLWTRNEMLHATVVELGVNAAGWPVVVVLLERSGLKSADDRALVLARAARFEPLPGRTSWPPLATTPLTWGKLVFDWQVARLSRTPQGTRQP